MSYLNENHPEIFFAVPRPGGIANIELPDSQELADMLNEARSSKGTIKSSRSMKSTRSSRSKSKSIIDGAFFTSTPGQTSRDHRIQQAMATIPWVLFDEEDEEEEEARPPNPLQDSIDILAVTITTVMLLAAGYKDISQSHLRWALSYLENVKDDSGNAPPNVRGIMNHIKMVDGTLDSFNLQYDTDMPGIQENESQAPPPAPAAAPPEAPPAVAPPPEAPPAEAPPAEAPPAEDPPS